MWGQAEGSVGRLGGLGGQQGGQKMEEPRNGETEKHDCPRWDHRSSELDHHAEIQILFSKTAILGHSEGNLMFWAPMSIVTRWLYS